MYSEKAVSSVRLRTGSADHGSAGQRFWRGWNWVRSEMMTFDPFFQLRDIIQPDKCPVSRDGKNHDFFKKIENIEKIENIGYFRYISDFFDIYPIHV